MLRRSRSILRRTAVALLIGVVGWLNVAYLCAPRAWRTLSWVRPPKVEDMPRRTYTGNKIPGDPINLALVGREEKIVKGMLTAGWKPADPTTLRSSVHIAYASVRRRPYVEAPVSNLFVFGRKQDLVFQFPVGNDPRQRHHVRFWRSEQVDDAGRPLWLGAATFDSHVGLSHRTGQVTHHIAPNVDAERDKILHDLDRVGWLDRCDWRPGFQTRLSGRNGGGDRYQTDGRLPIAVVGGE